MLRLSGLLYDCKSPKISSILQKRLQIVEMYFIRRMMRVPRTARRTNQEVTQMTDRSRKLLTTIRQRQLRYLGRLLRRSNLENYCLLQVPDRTDKNGAILSPTSTSTRDVGNIRYLRLFVSVKCLALSLYYTQFYTVCCYIEGDIKQKKKLYFTDKKRVVHETHYTYSFKKKLSCVTITFKINSFFVITQLSLPCIIWIITLKKVSSHQVF